MTRDDKSQEHLGHALVKMRNRLAQFERELQALSEKAGDQTVSILMEEEELRRDVLALERRMGQVEQRLADLFQLLDTAPSSETTGKGGAEATKTKTFGAQHLIGRLKGLQDRIKQMEEENRNLAEVCEQLREQNQEISNLYVAKHRLHATFEPAEVMRIIEDILAELVGAKEFGILILEQKKKMLRLVAGRGVGNKLPGKEIPSGEGIIGDVATTGKPFFFEPTSPSERQAHLPLATIPLKMKDNMMGVVVIFTLLDHKSGLSPIDHQLLELVAEHAPKALLSAHLYKRRAAKSKEGSAVLGR